MQHPYLFFSSADVATYRAKLASDPAAKARYDRAVEKALELYETSFQP